MKKALERIEQKIETLNPAETVKLETLIKEVEKEPGIKEAAIMLLEKYGIKYKA